MCQCYHAARVYAAPDGCDLTDVDELNANLVQTFLLEVDDILTRSKYLLGDQVTFADVRLFSLVIRHDIINVLLGRINHVFVRDLGGIMRWIKELLRLPGMRSTVDLEAIKVRRYCVAETTDSPS